MSKPRFRRRKVLVDKRFQLGIALKIAVCLACYCFIFCMMAVLSPFLVLVSGAASEAAIDASADEIAAFAENLLIPLTLTFTCLALHCILMSHKIAGPVYRFQRTFEAMQDGDLSQDVKLRTGDYLTNLADSYNAMIDPLRADMAAVKDEASSLTAAGQAALEAESPSREAVVDLVARAEAITGRLDRYKVERIAPEVSSETDSAGPPESLRLIPDSEPGDSKSVEESSEPIEA